MAATLTSMLPYALAFAAPVLLYPVRRRSRIAYVFLLAAAWAGFAGIRLGIGGNDYFAYEKFYAAIRGSKLPRSNWEPLFKALAICSRRAGLSYHGFLGLTALLGILPAVYVIDRRSGATPVGLFAYGIQWMFYGAFVILRQGAAMGLAFLAIDALLDRRWPAFLAAAIAAAGFHYSALTLLALPLFIGELKPWLRTSLFIAAGLLFFAIEAGDRLNSFGLISGRLAYRLTHYLVRGHRPLNLLNVAEVLGISILIARYAPKSPPLLRNGYLLYVLCLVLSLQHAIIQRMGRYAEISSAILLAAIADPAGDRPRERSLVSMGLVLYFLAKIGRWILVNANGPGGFLPYRTIL